MIAKPESKVTDEQIIEQTLEGNREVFSQLVLRYQNRLWTSINRLMDSTADAEDVVQDAFVQACLKLHTFKRHSAFYTWLYRIAFNLAYTKGRQDKRRPQIVSLSSSSGHDVWDDGSDGDFVCDEVTRSLADHGGTPDSQLERKEDEERIGQALNALSEEHRTILILRGVDGMDYDKIAETLELSPGTVKSRLHRARHELRDQLKKREVQV